MVLWCFDMFDLEKWGGERVKEIDETIKFRRKIGKMVAIKKICCIFAPETVSL